MGEGANFGRLVTAEAGQLRNFRLAHVRGRWPWPRTLRGGDVGLGPVTPVAGDVTPVDGAVAPCGLAPAGADSATEHLVDGVERDREGEQVAVVDAAVLELPGEVAEQAGPVLAFGRDRRGDLHASLDDPDRGQAGRGRPGLLPGSLPAGR